MISRRRLFGALFATPAVGVADAKTQANHVDAARQMFEVSAEIEQLRQQMEKPIVLTMTINGKEIAQQMIGKLSFTDRGGSQ